METIKRNDGFRYREKIYIDGKAVKSPHFKSKTFAKQWKRTMLFDRDKMKAMGISINHHISFEELSIQWLNTKTGKANRTLDAYNSILHSHILSKLGQIKLRDLRLFHAEKIKQDLLNNKQLSHVRINSILGLLKSIMNYAVKAQNVIINPFTNIDFISIQKKSLNYWLPNEANKFLSANIHSPYYVLYLVALNTGMRKGELCGLCWDMINFESRQIFVERSVDRYELKETTKSKKRRIVPMNHVVYEALLELSKNKKSLQYVFTDKNNNPANYMHLGDRFFRKAIKEADVKPIRFHDLRTTFASNFCMLGGDIFALSKILGHHSVLITQERYAELHPDFLKREANIISFSPENSPHVALKVVN